MLKIAGSRYGNEKVEQGIGQGNIHKHVYPVVNCADYNQQDCGLGADHINTHDPVNGCRTMDRSVQRKQHQKQCYVQFEPDCKHRSP